MLNKFSHDTAGQRKEHWETLRTKNVPRFLFRAFNSDSGGGARFAINNTAEIVPRGFMNDQKCHLFYDMPECDIYEMVMGHVRFKKWVNTEFSSWAASLHVVLSYAWSMRPEHNVHIAVLDRHQLDGEVLIWHAPHLVDIYHEEYIAHGCVRGSGYTAVPFKQLIERGLYDIFPELQRWTFGYCNMGKDLRRVMFSQPSTVTNDDDIAAARNIGALFNNLSLPFMVALLCLRPREPIGNTEPLRAQTARRFITGLKIEKLDQDLANEHWLRPGAVCTSGLNQDFPDIKQWIELLRVISLYPPSQKRKRDEQKIFTRHYDLRPLAGRTRGP